MNHDQATRFIGDALEDRREIHIIASQKGFFSDKDFEVLFKIMQNRLFQLIQCHFYPREDGADIKRVNLSAQVFLFDYAALIKKLEFLNGNTDALC